MFPRFTIRVKGTTGLVIAAGLILVVLIAFPAYRAFFIISVGLGLVVALILRFRNKYRPIEDKDVENKRPLGLD
jgi:dolichol kinase